jgi:hypothetical protein
MYNNHIKTFTRIHIYTLSLSTFLSSLQWVMTPVHYNLVKVNDFYARARGLTTILFPID